MSTTGRILAAVAGLLSIAACADSSPLAPTHFAPAAPSPTITASTVTWSKQVTGVTADGAQYAIFVPNGWNGDAVFYAHGIIPPLAPVAFPGSGDWDDAGAIRDGLGQLGYAVAYSTFSENGYAIKDGIQRTHELRGIFISKIGRPHRSFLVGHSLGAQVSQALAELHPDQYDGVLAMCGLLGGTRLETDYIGHIRTLFDFFYPGVLPGNTMEMPVVITDPFTQIAPPVMTAITANSTGFSYIVTEPDIQLAGQNPQEWGESLIYALSYQAIGINDLLARTHGHVLFDNTKTVYSSPVFPAPFNSFLNASISRYAATDDALAWLENNYEPTGNLLIPMITFHKTRDRLVPFRHEAAYFAKVAAAGRTANLLQRSQDSFGHCALGVPEILSNFQDLVGWVNTGIKPGL